MIDTQSGRIVAIYSGRRRATRKADALNFGYGAHRYAVRACEPCQSPTAGVKALTAD